jgi:hypothetical protein
MLGQVCEKGAILTLEVRVIDGVYRLDKTIKIQNLQSIVSTT